MTHWWYNRYWYIIRKLIKNWIGKQSFRLRKTPKTYANRWYFAETRVTNVYNTSYSHFMSSKHKFGIKSRRRDKKLKQNSKLSRNRHSFGVSHAQEQSFTNIKLITSKRVIGKRNWAYLSTTCCLLIRGHDHEWSSKWSNGRWVVRFGLQLPFTSKKAESITYTSGITSKLQNYTSKVYLQPVDLFRPEKSSKNYSCASSSIVIFLRFFRGVFYRWSFFRWQWLHKNIRVSVRNISRWIFIDTIFLVKLSYF